MTDRQCIDSLIDKVCDLSIKAVDKITELKQENSKLKQRVAGLENASKPKRKFKFMTVQEHCNQTDCQKCERCYNLFYDKDKPYKTKNGKYILIERYK